MLESQPLLPEPSQAEQPRKGIKRTNSGMNMSKVRKSIQAGSFEINSNEIEFLSPLGEGSMAVVYTARCRGAICAAKKLKHGTSVETQEYLDLLVELEIMATVGTHTNLVYFYGACIENPESPVIVEEIMHGGSLKSFLGRYPREFKLNRRIVYSWALDIFRGLDHLHDRDPIIMHRDLKPANLMLTADYNTLKLGDFGMSKQVSKAERNEALHKGHTGTLRYMAPEMLASGVSNYTEKADLYSAALIVSYVLTGLAPDIRKTPEDKPDYALAKSRWPELADILLRLWNPTPEERPSAGESVALLLGIPKAPDLSRGAFPPSSACCVAQ